MQKIIQRRIDKLDIKFIKSIKDLGDITFLSPPLSTSKYRSQNKEYKEWIKYVDAKIKLTAKRKKASESAAGWIPADLQEELKQRRMLMEAHAGDAVWWEEFDKDYQFVFRYESKIVASKKAADFQYGCFISILFLALLVSLLILFLNSL